MQRCDGINNCFDESDELFCGLYSLTKDLKTQWTYSLVLEGSWNKVNFGGEGGEGEDVSNFLCMSRYRLSVSLMSA